MGTHRYLSYTCQSCGNRSSISGWDQSKIPRCPTCSRAVCGKCGAGNFCKTCSSFLDPEETKSFKSIAWQARSNPVKWCMFCISCPGILLCIPLILSQGPTGIVVLILMLVMLIGTLVWEGVAIAQQREKERQLEPVVRQRINEARGGLEQLVEMAADSILGLRCPICGGKTTTTFVFDPSGRQMRFCPACNGLV